MGNQYVAPKVCLSHGVLLMYSWVWRMRERKERQINLKDIWFQSCLLRLHLKFCSCGGLRVLWNIKRFGLE
jgi:hypothetical protein